MNAFVGLLFIDLFAEVTKCLNNLCLKYCLLNVKFCITKNYLYYLQDVPISTIVNSFNRFL